MAETVFEKQGSVLTVKPEGRLDALNAPVLGKELQKNLSDDVRDIIFDFAKVVYIASAGMRVMLETEQKMEDRDGSMRVIHVKAPIIEVFELVGFMDIIDVEEE